MKISLAGNGSGITFIGLEEITIIKECALAVINSATARNEIADYLDISDKTLIDLGNKLDRDLTMKEPDLIKTILSQIASGAISERSLRDAINKQADQISVIWSADDVIEEHRRMLEIDEDEDDDERLVSKEDALAILAAIDRQHDACYGVNWETIECNIDEFIANKNESSHSPS